MPHDVYILPIFWSQVFFAKNLQGLPLGATVLLYGVVVRFLFGSAYKINYGLWMQE